MSAPQSPSSGGQFSVDFERASQAIQELKGARDQLKDLRREALRLGEVTPPASDQVSIDAAAALSAVAVGNDRSLLASLDEGIKRMDDLVRGMQSELDAYRDAEQADVDTLRQVYRS